MDEAVHFGHHDVVTLLQEYHTKYSPQSKEPAKDLDTSNLDGLL